MRNPIPELSADKASVLRIPDQLDVPVTSRVLRLIDSPAMQRLRNVTQLGLVAKVYPGATHSRFEHSIGVYALAVRVLRQLCQVEKAFFGELDETTAEAFLVAALLHDVAHWPYCHPIEDMQLDWVPEHEVLARQLICDSELTSIIQQDWATSPESIAEFLAPTAAAENPAARVLQNVLSGPVDIDKMDYLARDSLHAGVPYGRNFDLSRLINSLCVDRDAMRLGITPKGKTAAEMLVFSRYVMFSEVYWHHAVRSGTAMLQRCVFANASRLKELSVDGSRWAEQVEGSFNQQLRDVSSGTDAAALCEALLGPSRMLYKRVAEFNFGEAPEVHAALRPLPYSRLVQVAEQLASRLGDEYATHLKPTEVLIDAPPVQLEVQFRLNVVQHGIARSLGELSPVVSALATEQFDAFVKKVRVFVSPLRTEIPRNQPERLRQMLLDAIGDCGT